jgi:hypothetical protein
MTYGIAFVKKLIEAFCTALAIATSVHFLVLPVTVRTIVFKELAGYLGLLQKCLKAHQAYLVSLEDPEILGNALIFESNGEIKPTPQVLALKRTVAGITALHGKLQADLPFAKREVALGKIGPDEMTAINKQIRSIMLPTVGLTALTDLLERIAYFRGWSHAHLKEGLSEEETAARKEAIFEWSENIKALHSPFNSIVSISRNHKRDPRKRPQRIRRAQMSKARLRGLNLATRAFRNICKERLKRFMGANAKF